MRDESFGLLFSTGKLCYVEAVAQFLLSLLAQTVAASQESCNSEEGVSLWMKCGKRRRRRDSRVKALPSGYCRLLDQLRCSPNHTVESI